jgi:hypothetical protein
MASCISPPAPTVAATFSAPATGNLAAGQYVLTRLASGNGNSAVIEGLEVDAEGRLHIVGVAAATLDVRDTLTVSGAPAGLYSGGDPYLLVVPADYQSRQWWHPFGTASGRGLVRAVASRGELSAFVADVSQGGMQLRQPIIGDAQLGFTPSDSTPAAWLGVWGTPPPLLLLRDGFESP